MSVDDIKQSIYSPFEKFKKLLVLTGQFSEDSSLDKQFPIQLGKVLSELLLEENGLNHFLSACDDLGIINS